MLPRSRFRNRPRWHRRPSSRRRRPGPCRRVWSAVAGVATRVRHPASARCPVHHIQVLRPYFCVLKPQHAATHIQGWCHDRGAACVGLPLRHWCRIWRLRLSVLIRCRCERFLGIGVYPNITLRGGHDSKGSHRDPKDGGACTQKTWAHTAETPSLKFERTSSSSLSSDLSDSLAAGRRERVRAGVGPTPGSPSKGSGQPASCASPCPCSATACGRIQGVEFAPQ